jgi:dimethylhistidine N-methyltransferase
MTQPLFKADVQADDAFLCSVLEGLARPQKSLEAKFFYDEAGSKLFDRICELEEYYPTRTETQILRDNAARLKSLLPEGAALVELGSGSSTKTRILLDALDWGAYMPLDISAEHLHATARTLKSDYPDLPVHPVVADFTQDIALPAALRDMPKLLFFPGSTIGNFPPEEAQALLERMRRLPGVVGFVVGADLRKDPERLVRAYDDAEGVTAAFNKNLLSRMNRELGATFDPGSFCHEARWNDRDSRIEMHLVSRKDQEVQLAGQTFRFRSGESIHTENSHKYSVDGFAELARKKGWTPTDCWTDADGLFSVHVLTV